MLCATLALASPERQGRVKEVTDKSEQNYQGDGAMLYAERLKRLRVPMIGKSLHILRGPGIFTSLSILPLYRKVAEASHRTRHLKILLDSLQRIYYWKSSCYIFCENFRQRDCT